MFTKDFWKQAAERAVKTAAQAAAAMLAVDQTTGLLAVDWATVASVAGLAAAMSLLTSLVSAPFGAKGGPSVVA